jgi:hypothetical protein
MQTPLATPAGVRPADRRLEPGEILERTLLTALLAATLAALLLVARNRLAPVQSPLSFALVLWAGFALLYLALAPLQLLGAAALSGRLRMARRALVAATALGFLGLATLSNRGALKALGSLPGPARSHGLGPASAVLAAGGLLWLALAPPGRRRAYRLLSAGALATAAAAFYPSARASPAEQGPQPAAVPRVRGLPLVVIGIDGADWGLLDALMARGDLPNLHALRRRGAWGRLQTLAPTLSPPIWTTIATGRSPRAHGVKDFAFRRLQWVDEPFPQLLPLRRLGQETLLSALERVGLLRQSLISSAARRVPAFWNIAAFHRAPVAVVGWWATWPAEPVVGYVLSDRAYYEELATRGKAALPTQLSHPPGLIEELRDRIVLPDQVSIDDVRPYVPDIDQDVFRTMQVRHPSPLTGLRYELTYQISLFETVQRLALDLVERGRSDFAAPPDLFVLFRLVDATCHAGLEYSELVDHPGVPDGERRLFGGVVSGAYRETDAAVGRILAAVGEANVVVVSDHGFDYESGRYDHERSPEGVLIAAGPAFRAGRLEGLGVIDVMPLLLHAKGLPLSEDLEGRLPLQAFSPRHLESTPVRLVKAYGRWGVPQLAKGTAEADAAAIERLRALGYLQ